MIEMTKSPLPTRRGLVLYDSNPFMVHTGTRTRRVTNKRGDMMLVNRGTGEIQSNIAGFWESKEVDSAKFVKLYVQGVRALKDLTNAGTKVFEVLYLRIQESIGADQVFMSYSAVDQEITPMSRAVYDRGMRELVGKEFIAATLIQGWFWINPSFVWNGDRLAFVREYHKVELNRIKNLGKSIDFNHTLKSPEPLPVIQEGEEQEGSQGL